MLKTNSDVLKAIQEILGPVASPEEIERRRALARKRLELMVKPKPIKEQ